MTIARFHTVDPHASGAFHVVSRCVRRALLCGRDPVTGRDFSHRKSHIEERIVALAAQFAIGIYAYAVMSVNLDTRHFSTAGFVCPDSTRQTWTPQIWTPDVCAYCVVPDRIFDRVAGRYR